MRAGAAERALPVMITCGVGRLVDLFSLGDTFIAVVDFVCVAGATNVELTDGPAASRRGSEMNASGWERV